jgi:hypothetical protein
MIEAIKWRTFKDAKKAREKEKEAAALDSLALRASEQLTADDYILPYIDDNDSDAEEDMFPGSGAAVARGRGRRRGLR